MTKFQSFCCSSIDGLGEGAYSVLSVFVVRMTGKENIYKAEAWEVRRPTLYQVEQKCQEATQWVTNLRSWFSSCLLIRPLRIRTVLHMLSFLLILTGIFLTIGQTAYLFHFWCERGWLMILLLYLSLWGAAAQSSCLGRGDRLVWRKGASQGLWLFWGNTRVWFGTMNLCKPWLGFFKNLKPTRQGHNFYLSCWDVKEMDSEVCLDWIVHSSSYRTYWALMSWWWERHGAALGTPAEIWHTISMFFKWPCTPVVPTSNKERIVLR